ncbi:hypothetical protein J2N86_07725 [Legionella lytica]|uniref:Ankyrin repeat-containing protein n=1 Tax=Legionella lytica TaxID=96232 RepID=A0ABY4Y5J9_9GAMM|nr:hypothetical protein [Legionella lytica]USQ12608.1 hypothetical protein J2N86_07725 [Legionella lytica]
MFDRSIRSSWINLEEQVQNKLIKQAKCVLSKWLGTQDFELDATLPAFIHIQFAQTPTQDELAAYTNVLNNAGIKATPRFGKKIHLIDANLHLLASYHPECWDGTDVKMAQFWTNQNPNWIYDKDKKGQSPLSKAIVRSSCDAVLFLLNNNALITESVLKTALSVYTYTARQHALEVLNILKQHSVCNGLQTQISALENDEKKYLLDIAKHFVNKARALIPFSVNRPGGNTYKKIILLLLARCSGNTFTKQLAALNLDPNIDIPITQPFTIQKSNGEMSVYTLQSILDELKGQLTPRDKKIYHKDGKLISKMELIENIAKNAVKHGVGNCMEYVVLVFMFLAEYQPIFPIRYEALGMMGKDKGDHSFIVLNRLVKSTPTDLKTWGKQATICDPWLNEAVNVDEQLQLQPDNQAAIIKHCLKYQDHIITVLSPQDAGKGHSKRWNGKYGSHPQMLFSHREPYNKEENVTSPSSELHSSNGG